MSREINSQMTMREQIESQAGSDSVTLTVSAAGVQRQITITRKQADALLAGAELVVDPLTGMFEVRP